MANLNITDIPLSQLAPLHALERVTAEDVSNALSAEYKEFAGAIASAFNGDEVAHPELGAASLNAALAQPEPTPSAAQPAGIDALNGAGKAEGTTMSPTPEPQKPAKRDWKAEAEALKQQRLQRTQVNEDDYVDLEPELFDVPYEFRQDPEWVVPEVHYVIEIPDAPEAEAEEEDGYGVASEPEEPTDQRHPVRIWWSELPHEADESVIYRVVADDREMRQTPEAGTTLQFTEGLAYRDHNPGEGGLRHYSVWAYKGKTIADIIAFQPVFMGEVAVVFPPINVKVSEIQGAIQVSWDLLDGHANTLVYACKDSEKDKFSPSFAKDVDASGRKATIEFPKAGQTIVISLLGQANFRGDTVQSNDEAAVQRSIKLDSELESMELDRCERRNVNGQDTIEVDWTAPKTGEVKIYFSSTPPQAEFRTKAVSKSYVESAFSDAISETRGATPAGEYQTTTVSWPSDWYEVYVTPVNFNESDAWVGESKVLQRVKSIGDEEFRLIERVDSQLITFDWPQGATAVEYSTNREQDQVREEDYELQGGIRLKLDQHGDTVRLRPYAIFAGKRTEGEERVIPYAGLRAVTYDVEYDFSQRLVGVYLWSLGNGDKRPFSCQVVYHPERLPLYPEDGFPLTLAGSNGQNNTFVAQGLGPDRMPQPHFAAYLDDRTLGGGYIRLFAVEDYSSSLDSSFNSFGGGDAFSGFSDSYGSGESTTTHTASDQAVVVEGGVSYRLRFQPGMFQQNQAQNYYGGQQ